MSVQNVTLAIPKEILLKIKIIAAKRGTSISGLLTRALEEIVAREEGYQAARRRHLAMMEEGNSTLDTYGTVSWTRTDIHER